MSRFYLFTLFEGTPKSVWPPWAAEVAAHGFESVCANAKLLRRDLTWELVVLLELRECRRPGGLLMRALDDGCLFGCEAGAPSRSVVDVSRSTHQSHHVAAAVLSLLQRDWEHNSEPPTFPAGAFHLRAGMT